MLSGYSEYNRVNFYEYTKLKFLCLTNGFEYEDDENKDEKMFVVMVGVGVGCVCICVFFGMFVTWWIWGTEWGLLQVFMRDRNDEDE